LVFFPALLAGPLGRVFKPRNKNPQGLQSGKDTLSHAPSGTLDALNGRIDAPHAPHEAGLHDSSRDTAIR
jgi:hypothetical protein